jgi:predicted RNA polymerase sigma factor
LTDAQTGRQTLSVIGWVNGLRDRWDLGHAEQARAADERALALATNPAERILLRPRLEWA